MKDLIISIGTLDNLPTLQRCLHSIYAEDSRSFTYEVWILYNGVGDERIIDALRREFPHAVLISRPGPLGYCLTHNLLLSQAAGRYFLILDDDTVIPQRALAKMVRFLDAHPMVGIAGCKTLNADGTFQKSFGMYPTLKTELINAFIPDAFWADKLYRNTSSLQEVEWLNGSFMMVRAEVVRKVGTLDEHYYTYWCEADWCYRIRKAGWQVTYVPDIEIVHIGGEHSLKSKHTASEPVNRIRYYTNQYYFFRKHYSPLARFLLRPIMIVGSSLRFLYYLVVYCKFPARRHIEQIKLLTSWEIMKLSVSLRPWKVPVRLLDLQISSDLGQIRETPFPVGRS